MNENKMLSAELAHIYESRRGEKLLLIEPKTGHWWIGPCKERQSGLDSLLQLVEQDEGPCDIVYPNLIVAIKNRDCNLKCTYCFADANSSHTYISADDLTLIFARVLGTFPDKKINFVFTGGEPLLHFSVIRRAVLCFLEQGQRENVEFSVVTNGVLLDKSVAEFLRTCGIRVAISIDGPAEIHNCNRPFWNGRGSFDAVMRGLDLLRSYQIPFSNITTIVNPPDVERCYEFFLGEGIYNLFFRPLRLQGRELERHRAGKTRSQSREHYERAMAQELLRLTDRIVSHNQVSCDKVFEANIGFHLLHLVRRKNYYMCLRGPCGAGSNTKLGIDWNGGFFPCDTMVEFRELEMFGLDQVRAHPDLKELLDNSRVLEEIRNRTAKTIPQCASCPVQKFCGGGCSAVSYEINADFRSPAGRCVFERELFEGLLWKVAQDPEIIKNLLSSDAD